MEIAGLDIGRRNVKLFVAGEFITFPAVVGEWRELKLGSGSEERCFDVEYNGEKYFVGELAESESEFCRQMLVENKATYDAKLLALVALGVSGYSSFDVVTGLPVNIHDEENKSAFITLLEGSHKIKVNGVEREVNIHRVRVSVEGGGAFWSNPKDGLVRIIDGGSKTINYITLNNRKYIDRSSGTLPFGFDTTKTTNHEQMAHRIAGELGRFWDAGDMVYTVGGRADILAKNLKPYFPNIEKLQDSYIDDKYGNKVDLNLFSNALGYYNIGRTV